jgi:hypothetical protein
VLKEAGYNTTSLYTPSTYIATPALAEPREEEDYEEEKLMFESKTRGGYEYVIYKVYQPDEGVGPFLIHGAINEGGGWEAASWSLKGHITGTSKADPFDLIPLKKRRFKTAEELVANQYGIVSFNAYGVVEVVQSGAILRRTKSDTPEGNYSKEWLIVFTTEES